MRLLFLTDNFPPEVNAPATRTYEHCCEWIKKGIEVTVITCAPNFPEGKVYKGYKNKLYQTEILDGIKVIRVWTYITANSGTYKRTLDYISFAFSAFWAGLFQKADLIIATSPQFFTAMCGRRLSFWKRVPWIMEVRDIWPESIKTVGALKKKNFVLKYFERKELLCYKSAKHIIVVTDSFKMNLIQKNVDENKISVVKNGANLTLYKPVCKDVSLIRELGLEGKKIVGYIGTHGLAHKLDFILMCASRTTNPDIHYLLIGSGAQKNDLIIMKKKLNISNVTMLDSVSKEQVKSYISILDVSLINLKKSPLFTTVIPSKIFENAAMNVPILLGVQGEAQQIIESYNAGVCFEPESESDFFEKLNDILYNCELNKACKNGCKKLAIDFDRKKLAEDMLQILRQQIN